MTAFAILAMFRFEGGLKTTFKPDVNHAHDCGDRDAGLGFDNERS